MYGPLMQGERVCVYIDGYNLYFGLDEKGWRRYLWLDVPAFARSLLKPHQSLVGVKYFTTRLSFPAGSVQRQSTFLDALTFRGGLEIVYGNFIYNDDGCKACGSSWSRREEKQTDVGIAVHMLRDAYEDAYDVALLVSGDSDLVPVVEAIENEHDGKRVVVAFPPKRVSEALRRSASSNFTIGRVPFRDNQLPLFVRTDKHTLAQPAPWSDPDS